MIKLIAALLLAIAYPATGADAPKGNCAGSPSDAVLSLPAPLSTWGTIVCTPQGHVIASREGWIWTRPGAFVPVRIPSQMVQSDPEPLGNQSYFTNITFKEVPVADKQAVDALAAMYKGVAPESASNAYQLLVTGSMGRSLQLYFFRIGTSTWGIWCTDACYQNTRFMLLDMRKASAKP